MALELIYTSAPRGLRAGTSGYCTVAQTRGMREDLAAALERRSLFAHEARDPSPLYFSFRTLALGGSSWRVLSRAKDAGLDFTGRRHYLVHHLVLEATEETPGLQPAEILLGWKGWRESWQGAPEELATVSTGNWTREVPRIRLPAVTWKREAGDAGWATYPCDLPSPVGWVAGHLSSEELLRLMGESVACWEETQRGKSWLVSLDVGGAANPTPKDCLWVGRTPWKPGRPLPGVRSLLPIEECRGQDPRGKAEDIELARTGRGKISPRVPERSSAMPHLSPSRESFTAAPGSPESSRPSRRRWVAIGAGLLALVAGGVIFLRWPDPSVREISPSGEESMGEVEIAPPPRPGPMASVSPAVPPLSAARALQRTLWEEAGGREKIEVLHLLFGKTVPAGEIESELGLIFQDGTEGEGMGGPEGEAVRVSLRGKEERSAFSREAAKRSSPWTLFVPASARGLAYLPDPFREGLRRTLAVQGQTPAEILEELGRRIFLDPQRWSLVVHFPPWEGQEFTPVRMGLQDGDRLWINRLEQHRTQMRGLRGQALRRLAPWLGEDPESWDEQKIRMLARQMKGGNFPEFFGQFQKLDAEYRRWWSPPPAEEAPGQTVARLLAHPGVRAEVQLDGLAIGRLIP